MDTTTVFRIDTLKGKQIGTGKVLYCFGSTTTQLRKSIMMLELDVSLLS